MIASVINGLVIVAGGFLGIFFGKKISATMSKTLMAGLSACVVVSGISCAMESSDLVAIVVCLVIGTVVGEVIGIEHFVDVLGDKLRDILLRGKEDAQFTHAFIDSTLLFCVGSMAVVGSLNAGVRGEYGILISKSIIDGVIAVTFAATMGVGVCLSGLSVFAYEGALTLIAIVLGEFLPDSSVTLMTATGGVMLICVGINMLAIINDGHIRVANMLPGMLAAAVYMPVIDWIQNLFI